MHHFLGIVLSILIVMSCSSESPYYNQAVNYEAEANLAKALSSIEMALKEQPQNSKYLSMRRRLAATQQKP